MGSYTKGWRKKLEVVHEKIMDGYRRGVCDSYGRTVKTAGGRPIARPRLIRKPRSLDPADTFLERYIQRHNDN
jgi:hypothetical protein